MQRVFEAHNALVASNTSNNNTLEREPLAALPH